VRNVLHFSPKSGYSRLSVESFAQDFLAQENEGRMQNIKGRTEEGIRKKNHTHFRSAFCLQHSAICLLFQLFEAGLIIGLKWIECLHT
jgi:hypothetical protein